MSEVDRRSPGTLVSLEPLPGGGGGTGRPGGPGRPGAVVGTGPVVAGEHLEGRPVAGEGVRVGEQQLEPVTTAPSTRSLHVTVLVIDWGWRWWVIWRVPGRTD